MTLEHTNTLFKIVDHVFLYCSLIHLLLTNGETLIASKSCDIWHWMICKKLTEMSITANSSINHQDLAPILGVWPHVVVLF